MKYTLSLLFLLLLPLFGTSQVKSADGKLDRNIRDWNNLTNTEKYSIDYKFLDCDPEIGFNKEIIAFRFVNKTNEKIELSWHSYLYYNGKCKTCDYPQEYGASIVLNPNETFSADCSNEGDQQRAFFSRFVDSGYKGNSLLTDFNLHGLQMKVIK